MTRTGVVSLESRRRHPLIKVVDLNLFITCCQQRERYDAIGAARAEWLALAAQFQQAKGPRPSYMAEYCVRRAVASTSLPSKTPEP